MHAAAGLRSPPGLCGQVNKRAWWMPWRQAAMKDVQACEKPGGDGKGRYHPGMSEWGNPVPCALPASLMQALTGGSETSQYPEEKKSNEISQVAASERELAQKPSWSKRNGLERPGTQGETPVRGRALTVRVSRAGHVVSCLNTGGPSSKAEYVLATDSAPVPRGKGEKNPCEGSETESETARVQAAGARGLPRVTAYLLYNGSASCPSRRG